MGQAYNRSDTMINLTLTDDQATLVWLALKQAENNALDNESIKTLDQLVMIRLELEYNRSTTA